MKSRKREAVSQPQSTTNRDAVEIERNVPKKKRKDDSTRNKNQCHLSSPDRLSHCANLVDVLSQVHGNDLLRCKLVSRHMNGVIKRRRLYTRQINPNKPELAYIHINREMMSSKEYIEVRIYAHDQMMMYDPELTISIFSGHVKCTEYIGLSRTLTGICNYAKSLKVGSIAEGLGAVLLLIFLRYNVRHFLLFVDAFNQVTKASIPREWYMGVADTMKQYGSQCISLSTQAWPELIQIMSKAGCSNVIVNSRSKSQTLRCRELFMKCTQVQLLINRMNDDMHEIVLDIVKDWYAGKFCDKYLRIENLSGNIKALNQQIVLCCADYEHEARVKQHQKLELFIRRPQDRWVLCIESSSRSLLMYDVEYADDDLTDIVFDYRF